jgi:phosphinothricin acetyltransferase
MSMGSDLRRVHADLREARDELLAVVGRLTAEDFARSRPGGWTVRRVLHHLIEAEAIYAKLMADMCASEAPEAPMREPADAADAATLLDGTRAAVLAAVDGVDADHFYAFTKFGHEEFSPLSLLENIASHERDHGAQIAELAGPPAAAGQTANSKQQRVDDTSVTIRAAKIDDLPRLTEIYNHYIVNTATTFDTEPQSVEQRREWFSHYGPTGRHRLLVAERDGVVAGWASTSKFHPRAAYDTTVELTCVCAPEAVGFGIGQKLYEALFEAIRGEDIHVAMALITLPNRGSTALHERFGFREAMVVREVGRKFDKWWDVAWYEKRM